mmetsp:Transcript_162162/g.520042  ORF Transcript_162162/g.520042 Transcript_162162/m.520042 type:complete len:207 (+) Transcript_162162:86-706(+)|eukprot:CAMPEP_0203966822 /NCGR_PEP_ID=MMETSP0359-20131031/95949_1 /ASSEMBLY_ACC=CAM_ASM_000338 /TAXON_ID=268821 /ORGANISM="Scrippsiella Hangoei, Strain SHTV-5" /LENGTH=206 /DNA_ID=CAMNT_0050904371 /DNA_START=67 /DNA_END=687 /DNA_ORIENTATION=-
MASDPFKNDEIWRTSITKEMMAWKSPDNLRKSITQPLSVEARHDSETYYRVPMPGEPVRVTGVLRRPELNGAHAEVISNELDQFGRITVRVFDSSIPGMKGEGRSRRMKIQPHRLTPSSSAPNLMAAGSGPRDDAFSVRSVSRHGSVVGSVVSSAGRSVLSGSVLSSASRSSLSALEGASRGAAGSTPFYHSPSSSEMMANMNLPA